VSPYVRTVTALSAGTATSSSRCTRSPAPSSLTAGSQPPTYGLPGPGVQHLAEAERYWFSYHLAGAAWDVGREYGMTVSANRAAVDVLRDCRSIQDSDRAIRDVGRPEARFVVPVDGNWHTLQWVMAHMTSETARHAGHADIIRERLDGTTGRWAALARDSLRDPRPADRSQGLVPMRKREQARRLQAKACAASAAEARSHYTAARPGKARVTAAVRLDTSSRS
jgi:Protein of unknown function (DUF664)